MEKKLIGFKVLVAILVVGPLFTARAIVVPDLVPYQPPNWSDKIVVTRTSGSTNDSANLLTTDSLFVDWSVINSGGPANAPFQVSLYLDGVSNTSWTIPNLGANSYTYVIGQPIGSFSAGSHTVEIIADSTHVYTGTPNTYTKNISVSAVLLAAPTLIAPANAATGQPEVPFFNWNSVASASSYRIIIATSAADLPSSPTATSGGSSVIIDAVSPTTNFSPTIQLSQNTTYHWEVHAISSGGEDGTWSTIQSFTTGTRPAGLTIVPNFDSSITGDPNAATIEATINAAISVYRWNFSDAVTVNVTFSEQGGGLGNNSTYFTSISYQSYRSALVSHASTADDTNALAHLPVSSSNPVNGDTDMDCTLPLLRALGFNDNPPGGQPDGTVFLNTSIMNLSSFSTDPTEFSLFATVSHELNEVLGFGSALNGLNNGDPAPTGPAEPEDLFRYDSLGNRSLTTSISATSFFSLDGTTDLAQFNQHAGGDFGDWFSFNGGQIPEVQDAYATQGANPVLNVELRVLDVIGYHRVIPAAVVVAAAAPVLTNALVANGNFVVTIIGTTGSNYVLQATSRLSPTNWASLSTNTIPGGGSVTITNPVGTNVTRFYRAHSQ